MPRNLTLTAGIVFTCGVLAGCALLAPLPEPRGLQARLAVFPTNGPGLDDSVTIHWNDHHIPFIEASSDDDAAFALGLVHAHLRLAQMSLVRMITQGRLSEMVGPIAVDIDHGLRVLAFGRAASGIESGMNAATHRWTQRFVDGINHYQSTLDELPHEFGVLGLEREAWTVADVLAIGRLAGTDVNWLVWTALLPLRERRDWPELWARLVENGSTSVPSFDASSDVAVMHEILAGLSRSGSNSMAIGPDHTATGGAIIANDPHLGIFVPNVWLIAGLKSPSHHVVGLMGPGLPVFAIGRNPSIAWGGTNMRAASSDLYDVSDLPDSGIDLREETISVRWWFDTEITIRDSSLGPIISDAPLLADFGLPRLALKWTGHDASDEIGAMLAVSRARDFADFRNAFERFAVPGQNMIYADRDGNIGQVMAVKLPERTGYPPDIVLEAGTAESTWQSMRSSADLPFSFNPHEGFLVSANNNPARTAMPVGFFFSSDDRVVRMADMIRSDRPVDIEAVMKLQQDVFMASSVMLRDLFIDGLESAGLATSAGPQAAEAIRRMREWDGHYRADSIGAVSFEQFRFGFTGHFYEQLLGKEHGGTFARLGGLAPLLRADMEKAGREIFSTSLAAGLDAAAKGLDAFGNWSDMHRLSLAHPLSFAPVIGGRYRFGDYGVGGSSETLMKTAHETSAGRHTVRYGANARHVSDMTDMDENYFVLLGGQDGWLNSSTMLDQWPSWRSGEYVRVPLSLGGVREAFAHTLVVGN